MVTTTAASRHRTAAQIELAAAASLGCAASRWALAVLQAAAKAGRPAYDDVAAMAEVRRIEAEGRARDAVGLVAAQLGSTPAAIEAIARRLRRKRHLNGF